jgi:hypothetical protein
MSRLYGGIAGAILGLLVAALLLTTSQGENCSADWWACGPGDSAARTAQAIGLILMVVGPILGYRLGARLGPKIDRGMGAGIALGTLAGALTTFFGMWLPYGLAAMIIGGVLGGVSSERLRASAARRMGN